MIFLETMVFVDAPLCYFTELADPDFFMADSERYEAQGEMCATFVPWRSWRLTMAIGGLGIVDVILFKGYNVGRTRINHPFGNGFYHL